MIQALFNFIKINIQHRDQMWEMAKNHQKKQYRGSDMVLLWAFAKPVMYIFVFFFAISIGFKSSTNVEGIVTPYFVWLSIGLISFFYMRDMILNGANSMKKYGVLVARTKFPMEILPTSVATSYFFIHLGMLAIGIVLALVFRTPISIYWLQIPFYMLLMYIMAVFWSLATGIISVIYRDFYNFLQVINQAVFWLSAILFDVNRLGPRGQKAFMFNPITYIVEGYRNAICRHVWFWEEPAKLGCFLLMLFVMIFVAVLMYRKLRKRLPDVIV